MILDSGKTVFAACLAKISEWLNDWMETFHFFVNLDTILQPKAIIWDKSLLTTHLYL